MLATERAHSSASLSENSRRGVTTSRARSHRGSSRSKPRTALRKRAALRPNGVRNRNLYGYVLNDPVNLVDPSGLFFVPGAIVGGVVGAVFGGFNAYLSSPCGFDPRLVGLGALSGGIGGAIGGGLGITPLIGLAIGGAAGVGGAIASGAANPGAVIGAGIGGAFGGAIGGAAGVGTIGAVGQGVGTYVGGAAATAFGLAGAELYDSGSATGPCNQKCGQ